MKIKLFILILAFAATKRIILSALLLLGLITAGRAQDNDDESRLYITGDWIVYSNRAITDYAKVTLIRIDGSKTVKPE